MASEGRPFDGDTARPLRLVLGASFAITTLLCVVLLAQEPSAGRLLLVLVQVCSLVGTGVVSRSRARKGRSVDWMLAVAVINLAVVGGEAVLRVVDFRYEAGVQFGFPRREAFVARFVPDPELFWKYPPGRAGANSIGFRDEEVEVPKPPGVYRLAFLGDSCTDLGQPNYPTLVERLLNEGGGRFESVVLAVSGYSSHQGRIVAQKHGSLLEPDVAFVYFGWNDHWQAYGAIDADKVGVMPHGRAALFAESAYEWSRTLQLGRRLSESVRRARTDKPLDRVRVPPEHYRANLSAVRQAFAARGTPTVFITAPTSWYRFGVPDRFVALGYVPDRETARSRHREYNEIVREVALEGGAFLLDLEAEMDDPEKLRTTMIEDGVHFNKTGIAFLARRIAEFTRSRVMPAQPLGESTARPN